MIFMEKQLRIDTLKLYLSRKSIKRKHVLYSAAIAVILFISATQLLSLSPYQASTGQLQYVRAEVLKVEDSTSQPAGQSQDIQARIMDGTDKGRIVTISRSINFGDASYKRLPIGSEILLTKESSNGNQYLYGDRWHMPGVVTLFLILLV